jgi:hypothetical protein
MKLAARGISDRGLGGRRDGIPIVSVGKNLLWCRISGRRDLG